MVSVAELYAVAAGAGLLVEAEVDGQPIWVDFQTPDEPVLDGLALSSEYSIRFPSSIVPDLKIGDTVVIASQPYRVRDLRRLGDGSEKRARLSRIEGTP